VRRGCVAAADWVDDEAAPLDDGVEERMGVIDGFRCQMVFVNAFSRSVAWRMSGGGG
jgi:hypothetical protein